jgi:hypothetical protein
VFTVLQPAPKAKPRRKTVLDRHLEHELVERMHAESWLIARGDVPTNGCHLRVLRFRVFFLGRRHARRTKRSQRSCARPQCRGRRPPIGVPSG